MYEALRDYGDRFDTVGIFTFEVDATGTITETGTSISSMLPYIQKWPHIKWLLTIMNHGIANILPRFAITRTAQRISFSLKSSE